MLVPFDTNFIKRDQKQRKKAEPVRCLSDVIGIDAIRVFNLSCIVRRF